MSRDLSECLKLRHEEGKVRAVLLVTPGYDPAQLDAQTLISQLDAAGILRRVIREEEIARLVDRCREAPEERHEALVACGVAPKNGEAGRFEFTPEIQEQLAEIAHRRRVFVSLDEDVSESSEEAVNFREQSSFVIVRKGDRIGRIIHPTDGVDGEDIYGEAIAAKSGLQCQMQFNENIRVRDEEFVEARRPGHLVCKHDLIGVEPVLTVRGAVDFSTGNIRFPGDVVVEEGVKDQFVVNAEGSLSIKGLVEAATIRCGRHLTLRGGMAGREQGVIEVGRSLEAKYLDGVRGIIYGPVTIKNEVNNCNLEVHGPMFAVGASVRGGLYSVVGHAEIGLLGGYGGVSTHVVLGSLREQEEVARRTLDLIPELERVFAKAECKVGDLKRHFNSLTAQQTEELAELELSASEAKKDLDRVRTSSEKLASLMLGLVAAQLTIRKRVCAGVKVWMPGYFVEFRSDVPGPIELRLNDKGSVEFIQPVTGHVLALDRAVRIQRDERVLSLSQLQSFQSSD